MAALLLAALSLALDDVLLGAHELEPGWDVVREVDGDPARDPDLVAWGVRAQRARHYTRDANGAVQVCSVEVWAFHDEARARAAGEGFTYPDWRIDREGALLVLLRGLTLARDEPPRRGIFPDCERLGARIRARAARVAAP